MIPIFGFAVKTKEGVTIYNTNSDVQKGTGVSSVSAGNEWFVTVSLPMILSSGDYFISVGIASKSISGEIIPHDRRYDSIHLLVEATPEFTGLVDLSAKISVEVVSHDRTT